MQIRPTHAPEPEYVKTYFENIGSRVERAWQKSEFDERAFPEIAEQVLLESPPSQHLNFWDAIKFAFFTGPLPQQFDLEAKFGQPPVTVYWHHEFHIEILFWIEGVPEIHQHSFSGAFHVMHGSSLHTQWSFDAYQRVNTRLVLGKLYSNKSELLKKGDTRAIEAGAGFIHATYHLDRPSISVVVRTNREEDYFPQYVYLPPSIAYAATEPEPVIARRSQMIHMLFQAGRLEELVTLVLHFVERADAVSVFHCLLDSYPLLADETDRDRICTVAARRNPALVKALLPALQEREKRNRIAALRRRVSNPDLRFFLGLLMNISDRQSILELIGSRQPRSKPVERIAGWMRELSELGLLEFRFPNSWIQTLEEMLQELEGIAPIESGRATVEKMASDYQQVREGLRDYWLLNALFCPPAGSAKAASVDSDKALGIA
jgi:hypothetical protein